jgi:hypothetical protein
VGDYGQYPNKFLYDFCLVGRPLYYEYMRLEILYKGLDSTGEATIEELIEANHLYRMYGDAWRLANPVDYIEGDDDDLQRDKKYQLLGDAVTEMEHNTFHLFK